MISFSQFSLIVFDIICWVFVGVILVGVCGGILFIIGFLILITIQFLPLYIGIIKDDFRSTREKQFTANLKRADCVNPTWPKFKYWSDNSHNKPMGQELQSIDNSDENCQPSVHMFSIPDDLEALPPSYSEDYNFRQYQNVWYCRDIQDFQNLPSKRVEYKLNSHFNIENPKGYQISRCWVDNSGYLMENSRQAMCLYCQTPKFYYLKDKKGLGNHMDKCHGNQMKKGSSWSWFSRS